MIALYVFSLVLGGGFLGLSLLGDLFGGHGDIDLSGDMGSLDADVGGDLDTDLATDLDGDLGAHMDVDAAHSGEVGGHVGDGGHGGHGGASHAAAKIFSIRTVTYSLFGFGAVGTLLTLFRAGNAPTTTMALSVGTGLASGALINALFAWVKRGESGSLEDDDRFAGHLGRVTLPIEGSGGKILVEIAGREVELLALPHASAREGDASRWRRVLVVEMDRGVALVAPAEGEVDLIP
ncbi:MAG TPA: hypothetical protein VJ997_09025 [Longimicrobiales bacterium]|nr:hypothetical protein [Longimicrobiales bacterium]